MGAGNSIGLGVDSSVSSRVGSDNEIKFGIDNENTMGSSVGSFDGMNDGKPVDSLL